MPHDQKPINSGFGAGSTASDVLSGIDLSGKLAIVTGGHSGLGLETTKALAAAGAEVIVAARDPDAARAATAGIADVTMAALDLSDLASVEAFADEMLVAGRHIDLLLNNAGMMASPEMRVGQHWEAQFATNHLGHFALTNRLWPLLRGRARVVTTSSLGHKNSAIRCDDVQFVDGYQKWSAYGQSKTANALFAVELDRLGQKDGVRAFSVHPGKIFTPLQRYLTDEEMRKAGWMDDPTFKTPEQGAATQVWAATSPMLDGIGGLYCEDCDVASPAEEIEDTEAGVAAYAADPDEARRLWALSSELTGIDAFANR